ncbi:MAG: quinone-interacting membrane-bound oxidoreductase complex subunit QmoC [Nitrospiraceae bacterium]|nr:quinone-interacting membrane-bound oxidoreductase complex subunit QmoC [Nitrospiraceae bacterium]
MAEGKLISPDLDFVKKIVNSGGESLKKCYQCATCSVVCNMTPDDKPFPRKEMIQAQWGLKDKLFANPDIWLCHQCSDCTAFCPRGAKPGEVLGAIRKLSIEHYSFPRFLGRMVGDPKFLIFLLAIPVVLFGIIAPIVAQMIPPQYLEGSTPGNLFQAMTSTEPIVYAERFMPVPIIDTIFGLSALFAAFGFFLGITRYWKDLAGANGKPKGSIFSAGVATITEFLAHKKFKKCDVTVDRSQSHLFVFYGFVGLAITTTWAIFYLYGLHRPSPYPLYDPMKILGNASGIGLLLGISWVIGNRRRNAPKAGMGSYYDWLFISVVLTIVVSGLLSELLRLFGIAQLAYPVYFIHLTAIFFLFAYAPFSKMAHMVYRTTALVFAKSTGRDKEIA